MSDELQVELLDVRGEICPYPMIRTNKELDDSDPALETLDVLTDHPPALSTIPPEAMKRGSVSYTHLTLPTICSV